MKSRWLVNLFLLVLVVGIAGILYLRPKEAEIVAKDFEVSTLKLGAIKNISIEFPAKAALAFEKNDGYWYIQKPLNIGIFKSHSKHVLTRWPSKKCCLLLLQKVLNDFLLKIYHVLVWINLNLN